MTMERLKALRLISQGAAEMIRQRRPGYDQATINKLVLKLEKLCEGVETVEEAATCIYENIDKVIAEHEAGRI